MNWRRIRPAAAGFARVAIIGDRAEISRDTPQAGERRRLADLTRPTLVVIRTVVETEIAAIAAAVTRSRQREHEQANHAAQATAKEDKHARHCSKGCANAAMPQAT